MLGRLLGWRHARLCFQVPLLLLAAVVMFDGMRGPAIGAMNLAGVLPWIHWRGFVVLGLLAAGNVFCMACPFMLPRTIARRWLPRGRNWPRWLRNKWPAITLLIGFLWAYEVFALWDSPWWTAWIILAYFAAALAVDGLFRGASFCKYVCPIGQFNFVQSLISPLEIKVRQPAVCSTCQTKDCIRGTERIPGCELHLYQPRKSSNLDCTFCLDCIHACPHENIGILASIPGAELGHDHRRSGIGRFGRRLDLAALVIVLVFGAFTNAGWMTGPAIDSQDRIASAVGPQFAFLSTAALYLAALIVWPLVLVGGATVLCQRWGQPIASLREIVTSYSYALVPMGFAMWLSHYGFHLVTGYLTAVPTSQRFLMDRGWTILGSPDWNRGCCSSAPGWLLLAQIVCLDLGLLLSLHTGYRIALSRQPNVSRAFAALHLGPC